MLGGFSQDLRFSLRSLFRRPSPTIAAAVVAMALGIGAAVAIFSVVNAVLLEPLPYPGADRVVAVWGHFKQLNLSRVQISEPELYDYRKRSKSLQAVAAIYPSEGNLTGANEEPERISLAAVSPALFSILGVKPSHGRVFVDGEDRPSSPNVAVLSDAFWRRRQGADPKVIGRDILINRNRYTIIGIMPPGFRYPEKADLWVPLGVDPANLAGRGVHYLNALGRLKPGVSLRQAQADIDAVARQLQQDFPANYPRESGWGASLVPLQEELTGKARPALLILLVAVGLVLLVACANVANLLLGRALARSREIAVRTALGEPRGSLVRRFIAESLVVTSTGGVAGVLVAALAVRALTRIDPTAIPRAYDIALDSRVLLFAVVLVLVSGLAIGLVPAVQTGKLSLTGALKEGGEKSVGGRERQRVRRVLVVVETALALVLVIGAGLLVRTFSHLLNVDPGFKTDKILTLKIALPPEKYAKDPQTIAFFQQLIDRVAALPGVRHAAVINCLPLGGCVRSGSYFVEQHMPASKETPPEADLRYASPDFFRAMSIPLLKGRFFTFDDGVEGRGAQGGVVIVDDELARHTWPGEDPIGKRLKFNPKPDTPWRTVVGVVPRVKLTSLDGPSREQIYIPYERLPTKTAYLIVQSNVDPTSLTNPVREQVKKLDADLPIFDVQTMSERILQSLALRRFSMSLLLSLAAFALFLAAVGMYSVIAYSVAQRNREIGVRVALGAQRGSILRMVMREGLVIALVGIVAGLALAFWATKVLESLLFGLSTTDLATYLVTSLLLIATALAASYFPARRAIRVNPMIALGKE
ncbi:MAG: ABC transporter permease [Thermoanaerobaculia bacterium]